MKRFLFIFVCSILLVSSLLLVGCEQPTNSNEQVKCTVTLVSVKTTVLEVDSGSKLTKPSAEPEKSGYKFDGWYVGNDIYDWNTPITSDITIKAKFTKIMTIHSGSASYSQDVYKTKAGNTLFTLDNTFTQGTITFDITPGGSGDCGLIFGVSNFATTSNGWEAGVSYYMLLINSQGIVLFSKVTDGVYTELAQSTALQNGYSTNKTYSVKAQVGNGVFSASINDNEVICKKIDDLFGNGIGFRSAVANTSVSNVEIDPETLPTVKTAPSKCGFSYVSGSIARSGTGVMSTQKNMLALNDANTMVSGTVSVKMISLNTTSFGYTFGDNGIVFSVNDNDSISYWESGVEYYFFFINSAWQAQLGKVSYGTWENLGNGVGSYDPSAEHVLKVNVHDGTISTYVDDVLCHEVTDQSFILGSKIGIRAGATMVRFTDFAVEVEEITSTTPTGFTTSSGEFEQINGVIRSTKENSVMIKDGVSLSTGTISAKLSTGNNGENGIIFGGDDNSYYMFSLRQSGATIIPTLSHISNGSRTIIKSTTMSAMYQASQSLPVSVVLKDGKAYCYIDKHLEIVKEITASGNNVGVYASMKGGLIKGFDISETADVLQTSTLIFGHSYMQLWSNYKSYFPEIPDILDIGIGGTVATDWVDQIDEIASYNPQTLIYMIGINDMYGTNTAESIWPTVKQTLDALHEKLPDTTIVLINVNKCPLARIISYYGEIEALNAHYKTYADSYEWCKLVDFASAVLDENQAIKTDLFVSDNLHLSSAGYDVLSALIREQLGLN